MGYIIFRIFAFFIWGIVAFLALWLCALMDGNNQLSGLVYALVIGTFIVPGTIVSLLPRHIFEKKPKILRFWYGYLLLALLAILSQVKVPQ